MIAGYRASLVLAPLLLAQQARAADPESAPTPPPETLTDPGAQAPPPTPNVRAMFFTSPSELRDELAVHEILPRLYAGAEVEGQTSYEDQGSNTHNDAYVDSATGALRWVPFYGLTGAFEGSYDLHNGDGFSLDEGTITLGAVPTEPWYVTIGRTSLPFGEYNSHFREDPTTQVLGEIQGNEVATGYESDTLELTFAVKDGSSGGKSYSWIGNLTFSPVKDMDAGVYWASDISTSEEIKQIIDDSQAANPALNSSSAVSGAGAFMSLQKNRYSLDFEVIAAMDRFDAGLISTSAQRPWAWNFEATLRPRNPWEVGFRVERSSGIRGSPQLQFGPETSYSFGPHAAVSLEYLHGTFGDSYLSDRNLVTAGFLLRW
jgi:hypothetical protein